jgi:hypothetical protein
MAIIKNNESKQFVELLYWIIIFSTSSFLFTFHKTRPPIDFDQAGLGHRISLAIFAGVFYALIIWSLSGLLKVIMRKLYD